MDVAHAHSLKTDPQAPVLSYPKWKKWKDQGAAMPGRVAGAALVRRRESARSTVKCVKFPLGKFLQRWIQPCEGIKPRVSVSPGQLRRKNGGRGKD